MNAVIIEEKPEEGILVINGREFMINAKGGHDPVDKVKGQYKHETKPSASAFPSRRI